MDRLETRWSCTEDCNTFQVIGTPSNCPFCGTTNIHPVDDDVESYDKPYRMIVSEHDGS